MGFLFVYFFCIFLRVRYFSVFWYFLLGIFVFSKFEVNFFDLELNHKDETMKSTTGDYQKKTKLMCSRNKIGV